jgi:hypothetical protein
VTMSMRIEDIMRERGVGKKRAYAIRREQGNEIHSEAVPTNQRARVLNILLRKSDLINNSQELMQELQGEGYAIDGHDAIKVLWSLQKTQHVKFRERTHPRAGLFGIRLTSLGRADAQAWEPEPEPLELALESEPVPESEPGPTDLSDVVEVAQRAAAMQQAVNDLGAGPPETNHVFFFDADFYPAISAVRDRARKARKISAALRILEEVGEDEAALALMSKIEFSELEQEVINLLERYDEN